MHKSNKMMNNFLKQSTIQQPEHPMHNKRLSTGNIQDPTDLSFSMKKQSFHQRAETQLKNAAPMPFQQYDVLARDHDPINGGHSV